MYSLPSAITRAGLNPLQDLVNNLASGSASRTARSDRYGAGGHTMASIQVDDSVNMGSRNPSPGVNAVLWHVIPKTICCPMCQIFTWWHHAGPVPLKLPQLQVPASGHPSENVAPSPSGSTHSHRSLHSEPLSQMSINRNVTNRKVGPLRIGLPPEYPAQA